MQTLLEQFYTESCAENLTIINIEEDPNAAKEHQVRSVPWLRLGVFEFDGILTHDELAHWFSLMGQKNAEAAYLEFLLTNGKLMQAIAWLKKYRVSLDSLLTLMLKSEIKMNVRIGIGAIMEDYEGQPALVDLVPNLAKMVSHDNPTIRADVCHFLTLSGSELALPIIKSLLSDDNEQVRAMARESVEAF